MPAPYSFPFFFIFLDTFAIRKYKKNSIFWTHHSDITP